MHKIFSKLGVYVLSVFVLILMVSFYVEAQSVRQFSIKFEALHPGMTKAQAIEALGMPDYEGALFYLGQEQGFEAEYQRALASRSARFMSWHRGMDCVFTAGVDENDTITMRAWGCT